MHVQSCCFANLTLLLFCRCRCRHRRHCLSSLMCKKERGALETLPSRAPFFLASITFKPLLRRLPNMPMHNLQNSASFLDTVESAQPLCNYTKHQSYHQLLGSGCLPFTWANRSVPVWANGRQNSGLVNFALESQSLFAQISSIYQKTATKP